MEFHCLIVNDSDEREKVVSMFLYGFERLGEEKLIAFLDDLTERKIRLADLINTMEKRLACGKPAGPVKVTGIKLIKNRWNGSSRSHRR